MYSQLLTLLLVVCNTYRHFFLLCTISLPSGLLSALTCGCKVLFNAWLLRTALLSKRLLQLPHTLLNTLVHMMAELLLSCTVFYKKKKNPVSFLDSDLVCMNINCYFPAELCTITVWIGWISHLIKIKHVTILLQHFKFFCHLKCKIQ